MLTPPSDEVFLDRDVLSVRIHLTSGYELACHELWHAL